MGSLGWRIGRLEASLRRVASGVSARVWERYLHAHENALRQNEGLEPLPDLPYTEEDYEDDLKTLEETIPAYRNGSGWKTQEARAFLDEWERDVKERIERNHP